MMDKFSSSNRTINQDVNVYTCGSEQCAPNHTYGPTVRSGYMVYFVLSGKGVYQVRDHTYHLHQGQGFLIEPQTLIMVKADRNDPWKYLWIGFSGQSAEKYLTATALNSHDPLFSFTANSTLLDSAHAVIQAAKVQENRNLAMTGKLFEFLYTLCQTHPRLSTDAAASTTELVEYALFYISQNFGDDISVAQIAEALHIDRSYLHRLFKRVTGQSPQAYIKSYRMQQACELLTTTALPISVVARAVGYGSQFSFSKAFRGVEGAAPREWRLREASRPQTHKIRPVED
jgi:AraC-like DNA-binding protein